MMMGARRGLLAAISALGMLALLAAGCNVYKSDVGKLCDAEQLSQLSLKANRLELQHWMEGHVASSDAIFLVQHFAAKDTRGLALELREASRQVHLSSCALAEQAEMQAQDDDYQSDLRNLCAGSAARTDGSVARLEVTTSTDADRMSQITDWTSTNAKNPQTVALVAKLAQLGPRQRGGPLLAEAKRVGLPSCALAATLDNPPPPPPPPSNQTFPTFKLSRVEAAAADRSSFAALLLSPVATQGINDCYATELLVNPTSRATVSLDLTMDGRGQFVSVTDAGSTASANVVRCVITQVKPLVLAPPPALPKKGGSARFSIAIDLIPTTTGPGFTGMLDESTFGEKGKAAARPAGRPGKHR